VRQVNRFLRPHRRRTPAAKRSTSLTGEVLSDVRRYPDNGLPLARAGESARGAGGTGAVEIHLDAVDGPVLTTVTIAATANATTYASQTFPLDDPGGLHKVYLVFRPVAGGPGNNFFNLNWVEFGGQGISIP